MDPERRRTLIVVDAANMVGSRPDGWWRDRPGAVRRLLHALPGRLAGSGDIIVVVEGAARAGIPEALSEGVQAVAARGSGDDQVVETVRAACDRERPPQVIVVTSDRVLRARVEALGARTVGPRWLWRQVDQGGAEDPLDKS